jgi:predicted MFS family arabinose efflux permease
MTSTAGKPAGTVHSRDFRLLAGGQGLSWVGDAFQPIALSFAVLTTGGGAGDLGTVLACGVVARLVCTLAGGVWADRLRPQTMMIGADLVRAAAAGALALVYLGSRPPLLLLCALVAVFGGAGAFFFPAMSALKPTVVVAEARRAANATLTAVQTGALTIGPAAAGVLIAMLGAPFGFLVNALSFVASAASVALIRARAERAVRAGFLRELRGGLDAVRQHDWLLWGIVAAAVFHVANGVILVTVNVVAVRDLGGPSALGVILAAEGLGGVLGSLVALRARPRRPLVAGFVALGLMPAWVLSYVWPGTLAGVLLGAVIGYCGLMFFSVCWETAIQNHVPLELMARVSSWDILTSFIGMPLGQAMAGFLTDRFGTHQALAGCAAVILVAGVGPLAVRGTRRLRATPGDPTVPGFDVAHREDLTPASG